MTTKTNITPEISAHFKALSSGQYDNFCLMSCFLNGVPTSAICVANQDPQDPEMVNIVPLFVAITDGMVLTDHEGREA